MGYVVTQYTVQTNKVHKEEAREIAEAGINYYKWFLAHFPGDVTHGTGLPGPHEIPISDPEAGVIGTSTVSIDATAYCGAISAIDITSTGVSQSNPALTRTLSARYTRPTVAEYAFILNSSVWVGDDRVITGPYHSNGGIRMDGTNNSTITSGQETWTCTSSFGCTPSVVRDGVFTTTANPNTALFSFPSPPINFTGLTVDLAQMRTRAMSNGGLRFAHSGARGYRVEFRSNGQFRLYRVNTTTTYPGYSSETGWVTEDNVINSETLLGTYTIPASCPLIFIEDRVWLEGVVNGNVSIAAANPLVPSSNHSIIINNNITYATATSGLLAVAEENVLLGLKVPDSLTIYGIYVAQNGRYGRNLYCSTSCASGTRLPLALRTYNKRALETMVGTIVSNGRVGTKWVNVSGVYTSGFATRINSYDRNLVANPPPLTPNTSDDYTFTNWQDAD